MDKFVKDIIVKIVFVKSTDHDNNILTKILGHELHGTHSNKISLNDNQECEIFEIERKGVKDDV